MRASAIFGLVVLLVLGGAVALFVVQNQHLTATLAVNLGPRLGAWKLAQPAPVPALMGASLTVGLVLGLGLGLLRRSRSSGLSAPPHAAPSRDAWGR